MCVIILDFDLNPLDARAGGLGCQLESDGV